MQLTVVVVMRRLSTPKMYIIQNEPPTKKKKTITIYFPSQIAWKYTHDFSKKKKHIADKKEKDVDGNMKKKTRIIRAYRGRM